MNSYPTSRQSNVVVQEMDNELLIYDLSINKAFCLNQTSALVWQLCDGKNSAATIADLISKQLKMNVSEEFVWLALDGLKKDNLLENADEFAINFGGLNRRELIRKVGMASMVVFPLIVSAVAPSALMAQSVGGLRLFAPCTLNSQCASGNCRPVSGNRVCCNSANASPSGMSQFVGCVSLNDCSLVASFCCSNSVFAVPTNPPNCPPELPFACFCN